MIAVYISLLFVCLFTCLFICLFICLFVYLFTCLFIYLFTCLLQQFKTETGPASSRREQSRNLKKKLGEGIPGLSDYLEEDTGSDSSGTVTPDESESNHSSQVDLNEHPLMPISEEISPYETKKKKV